MGHNAFNGEVWHHFDINLGTILALYHNTFDPMAVYQPWADNYIFLRCKQFPCKLIVRIIGWSIENLNSSNSFKSIIRKQGLKFPEKIPSRLLGVIDLFDTYQLIRLGDYHCDNIFNAMHYALWLWNDPKNLNLLKFILSQMLSKPLSGEDWSINVIPWIWIAY